MRGIDHFSVLEDLDFCDGRITSPGKYEGEPLWVPYFDQLPDCDDGWEENGFAVQVYRVTDEDRAIYPDLEHEDSVYLHISDSGFVFGHLGSRIDALDA